MVVVSALDADEGVVRGLRAGATMYLTKPLEPAKLKTLITAMLCARVPASPGSGPMALGPPSLSWPGGR